MIPYTTMTAAGQTNLHRFVQPTSRAAYSQLEAEGVIGTQEAAYLDLLRTSQDGLTDSEAAKILGLPCSTVSARRNGIIAKHQEFIDRNGGNQLIVSTGYRKNGSGKNAMVWALSQWGGAV